MKAALILLVWASAIASAYAGPNWLPQAITHDNGDGTVILRQPYRKGPINEEKKCEVRGKAEYRKHANKNKICREFGYKSYIKDSAVYNNTAYTMTSVQLERVTCDGIGCCGNQLGNGNEEGIESLKCLK